MNQYVNDGILAQVIVGVTLLSTFTPFSFSELWQEFLLIGLLSTFWVVLPYGCNRFHRWYFWRKHDHGDVIIDGMLSDVETDRVSVGSFSRGTEKTRRRLMVAIFFGTWILFVAYLLLIYGVLWPHSHDHGMVIYLGTGLAFSLTVLMWVGGWLIKQFS